MTGEQVEWPPPPREPGPWNGGPPVAPPGNTPLPPLPGASGVMHSGHQPMPGTAPPPLNMPGGSPAPFPGIDAGGPQKADRAPIWALALSAIVVLALVAGAVYVVTQGGREYPSAWDPRVESIATWVAEERELSFKHPVTVNFLTEEEYSAASTAGGGDVEDNPEASQYYEDQAAQLRAFGFVSGEVDLASANDTLNDSGTLAYYDPEIEEVFVRGQEMTPALRVTLAHELTHVLQDQNFDLERLGSFGDGRDQVLRAVAEGDATLVEEVYVSDVLTPEEQDTYYDDAVQSGEDAEEALDAEVPSILSTLFAAPYILGPQLVAMLDARDGWDAIDGALVDPPTEEVLFDPSLYETDAAEPIEVSIDAPDDAEVIEQAEFGPTALFLLLSTRLTQQEALRATDGWGGDQYVVYRADDRVCVDVNLVGDTPTDTDEAFAALVAWSAKSPEGSAEAEEVDGQVHFRSCDPGVDAAAIGNEVTTDTLLPVYYRTEGFNQAIIEGASEDDARCFANAIAYGFTPAQLSGPFLGTEEGQAALTDDRRGCGL